MSAVEKETISLSNKKPLVWKRYIDDIFSLWNIKTANSYHSTIRFTAEISDKEITFLDTCVYKGSRFEQDSVLDLPTHFKPTETFQYTHFQSYHPVGVKKGFIKGKALRLLRTNSSQQIFEENICNFKLRLMSRGSLVTSFRKFSTRFRSLTGSWLYKQKIRQSAKYCPLLRGMQGSPC